MERVAEWTDMCSQYVVAMKPVMGKALRWNGCQPSQFIRQLFGSGEGAGDKAALDWALPLRLELDEAIETLQVRTSVRQVCVREYVCVRARTWVCVRPSHGAVYH